jgi:hypothetical protein
MQKSISLSGLWSSKGPASWQAAFEIPLPEAGTCCAWYLEGRALAGPYEIQANGQALGNWLPEDGRLRLEVTEWVYLEDNRLILISPQAGPGDWALVAYDCRGPAPELIGQPSPR